MNASRKGPEQSERTGRGRKPGDAGRKYANPAFAQDLRSHATEFAARQRGIDLELIAELIQRWGALGLAEELKYLQRIADEAGCSAY